LQIQIKPQISENQSLYFASIRAEWRISKFKTQSAKIEEILKPKMTRLFSSLCITNAICLTVLWILGFLIALIASHIAGIESLTTILKGWIWLVFIMDSVVCFADGGLVKSSYSSGLFLLVMYMQTIHTVKTIFCMYV
jgi:hypothetical protein